MTNKYNYDVIIIGSGPGGEGAAISLSKHGIKVAVIERYKYVGGGCTHWGTIPSKTLRQIIIQSNEFNRSLFYKKHILSKFKFSKIMEYTNSVIYQQTCLRQSFYERNNCKIFIGEASFINSYKIRVLYRNNSIKILKAKYFIIACGSKPYHPNDVNFKHPNIYDSDVILKMKNSPKRIIIYGAGVIGCEYASIFRGMNIKVDLINTRNKLLSFLDQEISDALSYHFLETGIVIRHNEEYKMIRGLSNGVEIILNSGKRIKADCLIYVNGRSGNVKNLNLKNADLYSDSRGFITVNNMYQTKVKHIYAVGDIIGYPSLASAAYDQGRIAAQAIIKGNTNSIKLIKNIPTGIYTIPEISSVGKTEKELTEMKIPYEVGRVQFKNLAKSQIIGIHVGSLKILFHREKKNILGIHCFGENASEIIHIGQAIMEQPGLGNNIEYFINTTFNYPTMAEAYRVAALNGLNRLL